MFVCFRQHNLYYYLWCLSSLVLLTLLHIYFFIRRLRYEVLFVPLLFFALVSGPKGTSVSRMIELFMLCLLSKLPASGGLLSLSCHCWMIADCFEVFFLFIVTHFFVGCFETSCYPVTLYTLSLLPGCVPSLSL